VGPLNPQKVDHTTDAWDTIDWLVKNANLPESNGKVGMIGSSYEGFTVVMALLDPHPALKVAAPQSPMVDGWMGDDWFHYGAFRLANIGWRRQETGYKGGARRRLITSNADDYEIPISAPDRRAIGPRRIGLTSSACGTAHRRASRPMTNSGRARRSTSCSPPALQRADDVGCRACGTRRICGARSTAMRRSRPPAMRQQLPRDGPVAAQPGQL
jgi:DNA-directed RNA polymerase subunit RPC12/RpoP